MLLSIFRDIYGQKKNKRQKQHVSKLHEVIFKGIIKVDINLFYDLKCYKKSCYYLLNRLL